MMMQGKKVSRLAWESNSEYGHMKDGILQIFTKGQYHVWQVQIGDWENSDWFVLPI